jgi:hypothetical protein
VTWTPEPEPGPVSVEPDAVAITSCAESFTLAAGHPLRRAGCIVCRRALGGERAHLIGAAALDGPPCDCSGVVANVFLAHADHFPMPMAQLQETLNRALSYHLHDN